MILSAIFVVTIALEAFLFIGKDYVLNTHRRVALEASLRQTYADFQESRKRIDARRAELIAAIDDAERERSDLEENRKRWGLFLTRFSKPSALGSISASGVSARLMDHVASRPWILARAAPLVSVASRTFCLAVPQTWWRPPSVTILASVPCRNQTIAAPVRLELGARSSLKILVVDDDPDVLATAARQLAELGYTVLKAGNGRQALKLLQARPDITLLFSRVV